MYEEYIRLTCGQDWPNAARKAHNGTEEVSTTATKSTTTRRSLIAKNIYCVVSDPVCTNDILIKIFNELAERVKTSSYLLKDRVPADDAGSKDVHSSVDEIASGNTTASTVKSEWDNFNYCDICFDLASGKLDNERRQLLRNGFKALLDSL